LHLSELKYELPDIRVLLSVSADFDTLFIDQDVAPESLAEFAASFFAYSPLYRYTDVVGQLAVAGAVAERF
jgi:hypothetical protein